MKKRILALVLLVAFCMPFLAACAHSPSKEVVQECARDVLQAVIRKDNDALRELANPDYMWYFSDEEMAPYYEQYEEWGICGGDIFVGSMRLAEWYGNVEYPAGYGSEAVYEVSIGGLMYEYEIHVVETDAGVGVVFFDLFQLE